MGNNNRDVISKYQGSLAIGLGWFSIALGVAEVLAPRRVARTAGMRRSTGLLRLFGLREIASGIGILSQRRTAPWLWARVAGDALDLATLSKGFVSRGSRRGRLTAATAAVAGVTALDVMCSQRFTEQKERNLGRVSTRRSLIINRPRQELYQFWRSFEQLPEIMNHLESVRVIDDKRSHWVAKGPAGSSFEWDAEIVEDKPGELLRWRSLPGGEVENTGNVRFEDAPGGRGTIIRVELEYEPPAGVLGSTVAKLFGEAPGKQLAVDMLRFKQLMETNEIARTEGQPAGRQRSTSRKYDDFVRS